MEGTSEVAASTWSSGCPTLQDSSELQRWICKLCGLAGTIQKDSPHRTNLVRKSDRLSKTLQVLLAPLGFE
ncbi:hypothetical protein EK904_010607 [Melospiza melodia maxima]|nr:hypothetical protein EK904_010607 [Melospiza melodia maxima]